MKKILISICILGYAHAIKTNSPSISIINVTNNTANPVDLNLTVPQYTAATITMEKLQKMNAFQLQEVLHKAIINNSAEEIQMAVLAGANVNQQKDNKSPLLWAVLMKCPLAVEELLKHNANDFTTNKLIETSININDMQSAVLVAKKYGTLETKYLGQTLLHHALIKGDMTSALLLIRNGANFRGIVNNFRYDNYSVMECLLAFTNNTQDNTASMATEAIKELIERGYNVNDVWSLGINKIGIYSDTHREALEIFLKNGANPNCLITNFEKEGPWQLPGASWTPLTRATYLGSIEIVKTLLAHGTDINQEANPNIKCRTLEITGPHTALSIAIIRGWSKIVKVLVEHGASV